MGRSSPRPEGTCTVEGSGGNVELDISMWHEVSMWDTYLCTRDGAIVGDRESDSDNFVVQPVEPG